MSYTVKRWEMRSGDEPLAETEASLDGPGDGQVLVEVAGCGVCHTDLGFYYDGVRTRHPLPLALGHEISGRVVATGPGTESWQDRAVIIPAVMPSDELFRGLSTSKISLVHRPKRLSICSRPQRPFIRKAICDFTEHSKSPGTRVRTESGGK